MLFATLLYITALRILTDILPLPFELLIFDIVIIPQVKKYCQYLNENKFGQKK